MQAGRHGLLDDVLDRRLVDDRQHLLRHGLRRGQEPRAEARGRDHGLRDGALHGFGNHATSLLGRAAKITGVDEPSAIDPNGGKPGIRRVVRVRRATRGLTARIAAGEALTERIAQLVADRGARRVSCYLPVAGEPDTRGFLARARDAGIEALLPSSREDGLLDWVPAAGGATAPGPSASPSRSASGCRPPHSAGSISRWCRRAPWTAAGCASAGVAAISTAPWRRSSGSPRSSRSSTTTRCSTSCPPSRTTCRWRGRSRPSAC
ncbi:MAG: hypothetical protein D3X82_08725 [Candidatus Leucobacter sulfamidivorax]|nr:hypothetical protein [Candidatus Leucobacter sulfamidivorax]